MCAKLKVFECRSKVRNLMVCAVLFAKINKRISFYTTIVDLEKLGFELMPILKFRYAK